MDLAPVLSWAPLKSRLAGIVALSKTLVSALTFWARRRTLLDHVGRKGMSIRCVARRKRPERRPCRREPAPARPPEPTSTVPAKRLQRSVSPEHLDRGAGHRVGVKERLTGAMLMGHASPQAATSAGSANAKPRRYSAAFE